MEIRRSGELNALQLGEGHGGLVSFGDADAGRKRSNQSRIEDARAKHEQVPGNCKIETCNAMHSKKGRKKVPSICFAKSPALFFPAKIYPRARRGVG